MKNGEEIDNAGSSFTSRQKRARWTQEQLQSAMRAVDEGQSVQGAAKMFNIPRRTLRDHLKSGSQVKKLGRNPYLTKEMEDELCSRIFRLCDIGMPITSKFLRHSVFNFCILNNIKHPFDIQKRSAGRKWLKLFLIRHPEVATRKAQKLNPARAMKLNKFIVEDHFQKLRKVMIEKDFISHPERIYNIDEKGTRLTIHHQQTVFARKGAKRVHLVAPEHAENITVVACANAIGNVVPPMVIFKGQRMNPDWKRDMPIGSEVVMSGKGSMTTLTFIHWLQHFSRHKVAGEILLIFDGASSHLDANIAAEADKFGITLYCLPSNTTHELQPMDKSVFKAFETYWDQEVLAFFDRNKTIQLRKSDFGAVFSKVWARCMTASNIQNGFKGTGVYPFDPSIIPEEAYAPSTVTQNIPEETDSGNQASELQTTEAVGISRRSSSEEVNPEYVSVVTETPQQSHEHTFIHINPVLNSPEAVSSSSIENLRTPEKTSSHSFSSILSTPKRRRPLTSKLRRKSLNYRGQKIDVSLFECQDKTNKPTTKNKGKQPNENKAKPAKKKTKTKNIPAETSSGSWLCFICDEDQVEDMSLCSVCLRYLHDKCGGVTKSTNLSLYRCPECVDSE